MIAKSLWTGLTENFQMEKLSERMILAACELAVDLGANVCLESNVVVRAPLMKQ